MYFPYLRCKQFELLALKEISSQILEGFISPVLEPVKRATGAFERTISSLIQGQHNFTIILNPHNGEFAGNSDGLIHLLNNALSGYIDFQFGIIMNQFTNLDYINSLLHELNFRRPFTFIHAGRVNDIEALKGWSDQHEIKFNLCNDGFPARRYRGIITADTKVLLDDKFKPQAKNADYLHTTDEFFSDDHLYYRDDGYVGFGDFLTIGDDYTESGWLPYAIAIHITYEKGNGEIWIRHFVSESNSDTTDVAGKFGEALVKLIDFLNELNINTAAANEFRTLHREHHYPGLGSIKKLSIMHHLELLYGLLNEV